MKKHFYTLTELLVVMGIIAVLAGIALPSLQYARQRARSSACTSNQGQVMKIVSIAMSNNDNILQSGNTAAASSADAANDDSWITRMAKKNMVQSLEAFRCPSFDYETRSDSSSGSFTANQLEEVYGLVYTTVNDGKMDFRGSKIRRVTSGTSKFEVSANAMIMGGCTRKGSDPLKPQALLFGNTTTDDGKLAAIHAKRANAFFLDGHSDSLDKANITDNYYFPKQTSATAAEAVKVTADKLKE